MRKDPFLKHEYYQAACDYGDMFVDYGDMAEPTALSYQKIDGEQHPVSIDSRVLGLSGLAYAGNQELRDALLANGAREVLDMGYAANIFSHAYENKKVIIGFSGFTGHGSPGKPLDYAAEATGITEIYSFLSTIDRPALSIDGGIRTGVLGLNAIIARQFGIDSVGFVSLQGLKKVAPHMDLIVYGDTCENRQELVGVSPDLLVVEGGKKGTESECEAAIKYGSVVLLNNVRYYADDAFPRTFRNLPHLAEAEQNGQLIVREYGDNSVIKIAQAYDRAMDQAIANRSGRLDVIYGHLLGGGLGEAA